jgi:hypothetical protein
LSNKFSQEEWESLRQETQEVERQMNAGRKLLGDLGLNLEEDLTSNPDKVIWVVKGDADDFLRLLGIIIE